MIERLGNVIYWFACILGAIIAAYQIYSFTTGDTGGDPLLFALFVAIPIWLSGWAIRYILSGKKTLKP